jgi:D-lyxose ketol-isomerase
MSHRGYLLAGATCASLLWVASLVLFAGCSQGAKPEAAKNAGGAKTEAIKDIGDGSKPLTPVVNPGNKAFYKADGAFDADVAKKAYYDMMAAYNYPIPQILKGKDFWVSDFVDRNFEKVGMAGIFWKNEHDTYGKDDGYTGDFKDKLYGYLGHEIYLLPGQMIPEHRHIGGNEGFGPKMEAWHIRYGSVEFFGEYKGAGNETPIADMPADQKPCGFGEAWFKSKFVAKRTAGDIYALENPESWHFQRAGPNGAIVSEYATYHNQVEFSKPEMKFASSEAKK